MTDSSPNFERQVQRLHQLMVWGRWLFVLACWLILVPLSLWNLRSEIALVREHFTWTAVRFGLAYNLLSTLCLSFAIAVTAAVLIWQSRNILQGLPQQERRQLEKRVAKIQAIGPRHPLWRWVVRE
jgi:heme exporter protein D